MAVLTIHMCCSSRGDGKDDKVDVVVLRYSMEIRSPGCMHFVLESVSADPPFLLDNRSDQALQYRQANIQGLPYFQLPAFSAAGFLWQVPARPEEGAEQAGNLLGSKKSDTEIHEVSPLALNKSE